MNHSGCSGVAAIGWAEAVADMTAPFSRLQDGAILTSRMELCQVPPKLTPFSYVVLALVGQGGAGPHDIVQMMREGAVFWTTSESHFYAEPKRLAKLGYLSARKAAGEDPRAHPLRPSPCRDARRSRQWLAEPAALPRMQHEAIVKLLGRRLQRRRDGPRRASTALREGLEQDYARLGSDDGARASSSPIAPAICVSSTTSPAAPSTPRARGSTRSSASSAAGAAEPSPGRELDHGRRQRPETIRGRNARGLPGNDTSGMDADRTPVLVGLGEVVYRPDDGPAPDPGQMIAEAIRRAAADAGSELLIRRTDLIAVAPSAGWPDGDPGARVGELLGIAPATARSSMQGGNGPQLLINLLASRIATGQLDVGVVCGGEALFTQARAMRNGGAPDWAPPDTDAQRR